MNASQKDASHGDESALYYRWQRADVRTRRGLFTLYSKPGMDGFGTGNHAATLVANEMQVAPAARVLVLNSGSGLAGLPTASAGAQVTLCDANCVAVDAAVRSAQANGLSEQVHVMASSGTGQLATDQPFDAAAVLLPKGKAVTLQSIWDAYQVLTPGGLFLIAGANAEGAKSAFRYAEELFGPIAVRDYRKGSRVGTAFKPEMPLPKGPNFQAPWLDHAFAHQFDVNVGTRTVKVSSRPGLFSWDRPDPGTEALLSVMEIGSSDRVLDLGCGNGLLGTAAAMMASGGRVLLLDAYVSAVLAARQTLIANAIENATVELSDCAAVVGDAQFDVIVTNPPFHQGKATRYDVAHQFIRDAARLLVPDGRFYLVANRFIPYEAAIQQSLGRADILFEDNHFKVILGRKV